MQLHQLHAARPAGPPIVVTSSYEDDPKFHSAVPAQGAASLYQRIRTKAGQLANAKAPASVVAALMFICLWAGATLTQHEVLPTPEAGGPMVSKSNSDAPRPGGRFRHQFVFSMSSRQPAKARTLALLPPMTLMRAVRGAAVACRVTLAPSSWHPCQAP